MNTAMLQIEQLVCGRNGGILLDAFDSKIDQGELLMLSGANGSGKSTMLKTIAGLIPPISGGIKINGNVHGNNLKLNAKLLAFVNTERVKEDFISIEDLIRFGTFPYFNQTVAQVQNDNIEKALKLMNIEHLRHKMLNKISDGEWQKANIARALVQNTPIVLMDEPGAFLDYPSKKELYNQLRAIAKAENRLFIVSTHDIELASVTGTLFWHIQNKSLVESNSAPVW